MISIAIFYVTISVYAYENIAFVYVYYNMKTVKIIKLSIPTIRYFCNFALLIFIVTISLVEC